MICGDHRPSGYGDLGPRGVPELGRHARPAIPPTFRPIKATLRPLPVFAAALLAACHHTLDIPPSPYPISEDAFAIDTVIRGGLVIPYGVVALDADQLLVTDRIGKMYRAAAGVLHEISGVPDTDSFEDPGLWPVLYGGLMDLSLHPRYADNGWIYVAYLGRGGYGEVTRFKLAQDSITSAELIFRTSTVGYYSNGMRIEWRDDTSFFLNVGGSTLSTAAAPSGVAQDLTEDFGKVHLLADDGSIPPDSAPFPSPDAHASIYSYGHRDVPGLSYDATTQTLYGIEHGPKGGDEFNVLVAGGNYGWPLFTYGINYDGAWVSTIDSAAAAATTVLPEHHWTVWTADGGQALAPACLLHVRPGSIQDWEGYFLFGSLAYRRLMKYDPESNETLGLNITGRVRTLYTLPGGDIVALIERTRSDATDGMVIRIKNAARLSNGE